MRDRIIHTQKERIVKLENELEGIKQQINERHDELRTLRDKHESAKERLVEQIVDLSDKFAANHSKVLEIAEENARLKIILESSPKKSIAYKPQKQTRKNQDGEKKKNTKRR